MTTILKEAVSDWILEIEVARGYDAGKRAKGGSETKGFEGPTIRLLEAARPPATPVERLAVETLKREGRTSLKELVEHVARELYSDEVRNGAWVLDIGLFGPDLFVPNVAAELKSGNGILWKIEGLKEQSDGVLPDLS